MNVLIHWSGHCRSFLTTRPATIFSCLRHWGAEVGLRFLIEFPQPEIVWVESRSFSHSHLSVESSFCHAKVHRHVVRFRGQLADLHRITNSCYRRGYLFPFGQKPREKTIIVSLPSPQPGTFRRDQIRHRERGSNPPAPNQQVHTNLHPAPEFRNFPTRN